jgi:hypothetical protein
VPGDNNWAWVARLPMTEFGSSDQSDG